jgi:formiminoglutamase
MELAQSTYLTAETSPWTFDDNKAAVLRPHLTSILTQLAVLAPSLKGTS